MFSTDRDLRKPVPKQTPRAPPKPTGAAVQSPAKSAPPGTSALAHAETHLGSSIDVVDRSRLEREERQRQRDERALAALLLRLWRCWRTRRDFVAEHWRTLAARLADVERLQRAMQQTLVLPPPTCLALLRSGLFLLSRPPRPALTATQAGAEPVTLLTRAALVVSASMEAAGGAATVFLMRPRCADAAPRALAALLKAAADRGDSAALAAALQLAAPLLRAEAPSLRCEGGAQLLRTAQRLLQQRGHRVLSAAADDLRAATLATLRQRLDAPVALQSLVLRLYVPLLELRLRDADDDAALDAVCGALLSQPLLALHLSEAALAALLLHGASDAVAVPRVAAALRRALRLLAADADADDATLRAARRLQRLVAEPVAADAPGGGLGALPRHFVWLAFVAPLALALLATARAAEPLDWSLTAATRLLLRGADVLREAQAVVWVAAGDATTLRAMAVPAALCRVAQTLLEPATLRRLVASCVDGGDGDADVDAVLQRTAAALRAQRWSALSSPAEQREARALAAQSTPSTRLVRDALRGQQARAQASWLGAASSWARALGAATAASASTSAASGPAQGGGLFGGLFGWRRDGADAGDGDDDAAAPPLPPLATARALRVLRLLSLLLGGDAAGSDAQLKALAALCHGAALPQLLLAATLVPRRDGAWQWRTAAGRATDELQRLLPRDAAATARFFSLADALPPTLLREAPVAAAAPSLLALFARGGGGGGEAPTDAALALRREALLLLAPLLRHALLTTDDAELHSDEAALPLALCAPLLQGYTALLSLALQHLPLGGDAADAADAAADAVDGDPLLAALAARADGAATRLAQSLRARRAQLVGDVRRLLRDLHSRWARRAFCGVERLQLPLYRDVATVERVEADGGLRRLLRELPGALPLALRLQLFRRRLDALRLETQGSAHVASVVDLFTGQLAPGYRTTGVRLSVRRSRLLQDALEQLGGADVAAAVWRDRFVVSFVSDVEPGRAEMGIDAGGLFKDFFTELAAQTFDPRYGLFAVTADGLLYPSPAAALLLPDRHELQRTFRFLGRVLGKALYENVAIAPQFAHFFLAHMAGRYQWAQLLSDLAAFDAELARNLLFLRSYDGDVAALELSFAVSDDSLGAQRELDLCPRGRDLRVTRDNRHRYVSLVAKHYLHDRLQPQAAAFFAGLRDVVPAELCALFDAAEWQVVISGADARVDVADLRRHTQYAGGFFAADPTVLRFWSVVEGDLSDEERALLLRFVTACPRAPPLGFAALTPAFTLQRADGGDQRLPTASTCFNVLKLPPYSSRQILRDKLRAAITANANFDLS